MTPEERDRWAEQWMDAALEQRRNAEPRPGLEGRVLAKLVTARTQPARVSWLRSWTDRRRMVAIGVAAILMFAAAYALRPAHRERQHGADGTPKPAIAAPSASNGPGVSALPGAASHSANARVGRTRINSGRKLTGIAVARASRQDVTQTPRLAQFPAPAPLTSQEQLLLRYVQQTPREELIAVVNEKRLFEESSRGPKSESQRLRAPIQ